MMRLKKAVNQFSSDQTAPACYDNSQWFFLYYSINPSIKLRNNFKGSKVLVPSACFVFSLDIVPSLTFYSFVETSDDFQVLMYLIYLSKHKAYQNNFSMQ